MENNLLKDKPSDLLKKLRVTEEVEIGVAKRIDKIPLKKPAGFFKVKDVDLENIFLGYQDDIDGGFYVFGLNLVELGIKELRKYLLVPYTDRYGNLFVWPIKLPKDDQQQGLSWSESAIFCAKSAVSKWVKIESNRCTHTYDVYVAEGIENEPNWHNQTTEDLIFKAIEKQFVNDPEHEVIKKLQGRA